MGLLQKIYISSHADPTSVSDLHTVNINPLLLHQVSQLEQTLTGINGLHVGRRTGRAGAGAGAVANADMYPLYC